LKKVILDTNVVLDVLLERRPFVLSAAEIFELAEQSRVVAFLCATTITTVDYLLRQSLSARESRQTLWKLLSLFEIAPVNRTVIEQAMRSRISDFEDAVLDEAGMLAGVEAIVTRNSRDFAGSRLRILDPLQFLAQVEQ
jgi:predicted nucleic acid-binding protein